MIGSGKVDCQGGRTSKLSFSEVMIGSVKVDGSLYRTSTLSSLKVMIGNGKVDGPGGRTSTPLPPPTPPSPEVMLKSEESWSQRRESDHAEVWSPFLRREFNSMGAGGGEG